MENLYQLYNRSKEKEELLSNFEKSIRNKDQSAFIIRGKKGIGKTRLIFEFINEIERDIALLSEIPTFKREKNVISFECEKNSTTPYLPFIKITKSILQQKWLLNIGYNLLKLGLALFGINDALNALKDLANSIVENKNTEKLHQKEIRLFNQYRKFIKRRSSRSPLIIFIQNIQWIDSYSLKLIQKLISEKNKFWGMIILEQDEYEIPEELDDEFRIITSSDKLINIDLFALDKYFPAKLLSSRFGDNFFNADENDLLYTISEGTPGTLIDFVENTCIRNNYLYFEKGVWKKKEDFKESIKPANQKLLELIISLCEDKELSESELRLIKKMSLLWGISNSYVSQTVNMVKDVISNRFRINQILDTGIIGNNSFSVTDNDNKRFIVEHVRLNSQDKRILYESRGFENKHLLEVSSLKVCENGVLIIWDYYDGKKTRQVIIEEFEKRVQNNIQKFIQISEGLAELHKNSIVHGFLKPRSIIETGDGKFQLATIDQSIFKYFVFDSEENNSSDIYFIAPEQLKGSEPNIQSDIFSLGVLFYHALTNKFPFHGRSSDDLINSIINDKIDFKGKLESIIPVEIIEILQTSLSFNPQDRFKSAEEFYEKLVAIRFVPRPKPDSVPLDPKQPPKTYAKYLLALGVIALVIAGFIFSDEIINFLIHKKKFIRDESTIIVESYNKTSDSLKILDPDIIEYLLRYNISNKSNLTIINSDQFKTLYPESRKEINLPQKSINCQIINEKFGYEIDMKIIDNNQNGSIINKKIIFRDPSELLNGRIDNLTSYLGTKNPKKNLLTEDWDAFFNFYKGEINWNILNINEAKKFFRKSIAIDPSFLLPQLRLAKIYRFDGNNTAAIKLLEIVKASANNLATPDSLIAVALWNILNGKTRDAINNYKELISYMPAQKEPYYELAEAYFDQRDITNAIINYGRALEIDPDFTLALNHYGYSLSHSGQHDSALIYFKKYVSLEPTANAYDSYGDGFFACGDLDSAKCAKLKGLELDPNLDYLYSGLAYINIREGKLKEAESNINKYLSYQKDPELISTGLTDKALIYFVNKDFRKSLDTCLKAKALFDSKDLVTRNHVLHWLLSKIYIETNNSIMLRSEIKDMQDIMANYKIDEFNYNMIYKFYNDINIHLLIRQNEIGEAKEVISIYDNEIYTKVKDWNSPYDIAFFNTEFGKLFLEKDSIDLARERFLKALSYNPNYALAHYYISLCFTRMNLPDEAKKHLDEFNRLINHADNKYIAIIRSEFIN